MRALIACGWFGINAWIGGAALQVFFVSLVAGLARPARDSSYPTTASRTRSGSRSLLFWGLNILIIFRGMECSAASSGSPRRSCS